MRRNRLVVLAVLVVVVGGGWWSLARTNISLRESYEENLVAARDAASRGVTRDVVAGYEAALKLQPEWPLQRELLDYLAANESHDVYGAALERALRGFPDQAFPYEELLRIALEDGDHDTAYEILDRAGGASVSSDRLTAASVEIAYDYDLSGSGYVDAIPFVNGVAAVATSGGWRLIDSSVRSLGPSHAKIGPAGDDSVPVIDDEGVPYFVDLAGARSLAATRTSYTRLGPKVDGIFPAQRSDGRWVYLDESFMPVMADATFDEAGVFSDGLAPVRVGETWKVVGRDGTVVVDGLLEVALDAQGSLGSSGRFFGRTSDGFRMFDASGSTVSDLVLEAAHPFADGGAAVRSGGVWGFVDPQGAWLLQPTYEDARSFAVGLAPVQQGGVWGYVNGAGTLVIEPAFRAATAFTPSGASLVLVAGPSEGDAASWKILQLLRHKR